MKPYWQSGNALSSLYNCDALELMASIEDNSIDCIWTDPPYFLSNDGTTAVAGKRVKVNKGEWDRSRGFENDHEFNRTWLAECHRILKVEGTIWATGTFHVYPSVGAAMMQEGFFILTDVIWQKPNPPPNLGRRTFTHASETVLWAIKPKKRRRRPYSFDYKALLGQKVWTIPAARKGEKLFGKHPTQKPLELIDRCLEVSTRPGDVVLDPFAGSGTTGVAALRLDRRFIGSEQETEFVELASKRLSAIEDEALARS